MIHKRLIMMTFTVIGCSSAMAVKGAAVSRTRIPLTVHDLLQYGADPTGQRDSTAAVMDWISDCKKGSGVCWAPAGTYSVAPMQWDVSALTNSGHHGFTVNGDGCNRTVFSVRGNPASGITLAVGEPNLRNGRGDNAYTVLNGVGFAGDIAGPVLQLGRDDFSDSMNGLDFSQVCVNNANTSTKAVGVRVNSVITSRLWMSVSMNFSGTACEIRSANFTTFQGSCGGGDTGIYLTGPAAIIGNTFLNMDLEVNLKNVVVDGTAAARNTFIGGQFDYQYRNGPCAIDDRTGVGTRFVNPNIAGESALCPNASRSLTLEGVFSVAQPRVPDSGLANAIRNTSGQAVAVTVWGSGLANFCINGSCPPAGASATFMLAPGDEVALLYTLEKPVWTWRSMP